MNDDTMGCLEDGKISLESYEKPVDFIRSREVRLKSRSSRGTSSKDPNAMVYGVGEGATRYDIHTPEDSSASPDAGSSQRSSSPWTPSGRQDKTLGTGQRQLLGRARLVWSFNAIGTILTPSRAAKARAKGDQEYLSATTASGKGTPSEYLP